MKQSLQEQLRMQSLVVEELKRSLKDNESKLRQFETRANDNHRALLSVMSFLVFVPLLLQTIFIGPLPDNWQNLLIGSEVYFILVGSILTVTIPFVAFGYLIIKIWK